MGLIKPTELNDVLQEQASLTRPASLQDELLAIANLTQADWTSQQRRVPQQEVRAVIQDFGEDSDKAHVALNSLAAAGTFASLNGVLNYFQNLQEIHPNIAILDICPTSIGASISYLFNRSYFKDHPTVAFNYEEEVSGQAEARMKTSQLLTYPKFKSWAGSKAENSPQKAVLFLDQATYNFLDTQPEMVETLRGILTNPNVILISSIGFDQGISALNWNPTSAKQKIRAVLDQVKSEVSRADYEKMPTDELQERISKVFKKSDPWARWLNKRYGNDEISSSSGHSPLSRFHQLQPNYIGAGKLGSKPTIDIETTQNLINMEQPNSTVSELLGIFKTIRSESPDKLSQLVAILREHSKVYTWFRLANIARSMHTEINLCLNKKGKEPIFLIPAKGKSFSLASETYRQANGLPTKVFWDFDRLKAAISHDPTFKERHAIVVIDDLSASGESSEKVIRKVRRLGDFHNLDRKSMITTGSYPDLTADETKFDGEIIIAPFSGSTYARKYLLDRNYRNVEFIAGDLIKPYYELALFTQASMGEKLSIQKMLRDGTGTLGYRELGLMTVFPWGGPNNIPNVFARFTGLFAPLNGSKHPYDESKKFHSV